MPIENYPNTVTPYPSLENVTARSAVSQQAQNRKLFTLQLSSKTRLIQAPPCLNTTSATNNLNITRHKGQR